MQLNQQTKKMRVSEALCMVTANLLLSNAVLAQVNIDIDAPDSQQQNTYDQPAESLGTNTLDSAVVFYSESDGRVKTIEPMISFNHTSKNGDSYDVKVVYDSLTGATPNGAIPSNVEQTFTAASIPTTTIRTGASGRAVTVYDPSAGLVYTSYNTPLAKLPLADFNDRRYAVDLGYATDLNSDNPLSVGANYSSESDFKSTSLRASLSHTLANGNTTLSIGGNYEKDTSTPNFGIPKPLGVTSNSASMQASDSKTVNSLMLGVSQVMTRNWLMSANLSWGRTNGYQTDPYKVVSVVSSTTYRPWSYLYESRPDSRQRTALYVDNKFATGSWVTDIGARYYKDDWGIKSTTLELSEHIPVGSSAYIEPVLRFYKQSEADFFQYYLTSTEPHPEFISADSRLDAFKGITYGLRAGMNVAKNIEVYGMLQYYKQSASNNATLPGSGNDNLNLFAGTNAVSALAGVKWRF